MQPFASPQKAYLIVDLGTKAGDEEVTLILIAAIDHFNVEAGARLHFDPSPAAVLIELVFFGEKSRAAKTNGKCD